MKKVYNKLVRDKIPEIIVENGSECNCRILDEAEYATMLNAKLLEECNEWIADEDITEIADVLEVLYAIAELKGYSWEEVERVQRLKKDQRGGFTKRVYLEEVDTDK